MVNGASNGVQAISSNAGSASIWRSAGVSVGETSPAPNTTIADGVPEAESSVFIALRTQDWLSPEDLMARAAVAVDTARACCERFWQMGLLVRRGGVPPPPPPFPQGAPAL